MERVRVVSLSYCLLMITGIICCAYGARTTITVGGTLSLSGRYSNVSNHVLQAYLALRDEVNNNAVGGLTLDDGNAYRLEFYFEDDSSSDASVRALYQHMLDENRTECLNLSRPCFRSSGLAGWKPDLLLAPYGNDLAAEAALIAEAAGIVMVSGSTLNETVLAGSEFTFAAGLSLSHAILQGLRKLLAFGVASVAYINGKDPNDAQLCDEIVYALRNLNDRLAGSGLEEVSIQNVGQVRSVVDLQPKVADMHASKPDVALACLSLDLCLEFLDISNETNFEPPAMLLPTCVAHPDFRALAGRKGDYVIGALPWNLNSVSFQEVGMSMGAWQGAVQLNRSASLSVGYHYVAALALSLAVTDAQSVDPLKVAYALRKLSARTAFGDIHFDYKGQNEAEPTVVQLNPQALIQNRARHENQSNYRQLWPQKGPLVYPLYPARSVRQRTCELAQGPNSCHCSLEGCPDCSEVHWASHVSSCDNYGAYGTREITFAWTAPCSKGLPLPESRKIGCNYVVSDSIIALFIAGWTGISALTCAYLGAHCMYHASRPSIKHSGVWSSVLLSTAGATVCTGNYLRLGVNTSEMCIAREWLLCLGAYTVASLVVGKLFYLWQSTLHGGEMPLWIPPYAVSSFSLVFIIGCFALLLLATALGLVRAGTVKSDLSNGVTATEAVCLPTGTIRILLDFGTASLLLAGACMSAFVSGKVNFVSYCNAELLVVVNILVLWSVVQILMRTIPWPIAVSSIAILETFCSVSSVLFVVRPKLSLVGLNSEQLEQRFLKDVAQKPCGTVRPALDLTSEELDNLKGVEQLEQDMSSLEVIEYL